MEELETADLYPNLCASILRCLSGCDGRLRQHSELIHIDGQCVSVHAEKCKKANSDLDRFYELRVGVEELEEDTGQHNEGLLGDLTECCTAICSDLYYIEHKIQTLTIEHVPGVLIEYGYVQHVCYYGVSDD